MKKFLQIIVIVALFAVGFHYKDELAHIFIPKPCTEPIPYELVTFDTKFNISQKYFLSALSDAEAIWEKPYGKQLFTYAPTDKATDVLKINLIYDYRQQATSKLSSLGITVSDNRVSYDMLKAKFTALKTQYEQEKKALEVRITAWNQTDRTDKREYQAIQTIETDINSKADEINALVVVLNRLVASLNLSVEKYNTTNQTRGESFEEGVYQSDGLSREIDIYEFSNREKLVRVLAHEFGHALGLDHVSDPKAIMYSFNQGNNETLTKADLNELKLKCPVK